MASGSFAFGLVVLVFALLFSLDAVIADDLYFGDIEIMPESLWAELSGSYFHAQAIRRWLASFVGLEKDDLELFFHFDHETEKSTEAHDKLHASDLSACSRLVVNEAAVGEFPHSSLCIQRRCGKPLNTILTQLSDNPTAFQQALQYTFELGLVPVQETIQDFLVNMKVVVSFSSLNRKKMSGRETGRELLFLELD